MKTIEPEICVDDSSMAPWLMSWPKRIFDVILAIILVPFVLVVAVALVCANPFLNPGPLLFQQERVGLGGRRFRIWKFRSMSGRDPGDAFVTTQSHRITPLGGVLRRMHLDELPQIWNLLTGTMSMVGPRPEQTHYTVVFGRAIPDYAKRHLCRPGITGLAQVGLGYTDTLAGARQKLALDRAYIRRASLYGDLGILCRSLRILCVGRPNRLEREVSVAMRHFTH